MAKSTKKQNNKRGRPSKFNQKVADEILVLTATTRKGTHEICKRLKISPSTLFDWLSSGKYPEFSDSYARAKEVQAELLAQEILTIAYNDKDDEKPFVGINHVHRDKLKIDSLKWLLAKLQPKKYGDRVELAGDKENPVEFRVTGMVIK